MLRQAQTALVFRAMSDADFKLVHSLSAVVGWLELGNTKEARAELDSIDEEYRHDTNVLDLEWLLHAHEANWTAALQIANRLIEVAPEWSCGWLHRAFALRRIPNCGLEPAAETLRAAFEKFPEEPTIPFNLACYACQLGHLDEARRWLRKAFSLDKDAEVKKMALADTDLEALWAEIKSW
jgi:tetratricopeptide (TPR) repeat protein